MHTDRALTVLDEKDTNQITALNRRSVLSRVGALAASTALPAISGGGLLMMHGNAKAVYTQNPLGIYIADRETSRKLILYKNETHSQGFVFRSYLNPATDILTVYCYSYYIIYRGLSDEVKNKEYELLITAARSNYYSYKNGYLNVKDVPNDKNLFNIALTDLLDGGTCRSKRRQLSSASLTKAAMKLLIPAALIYTDLVYQVSNAFEGEAAEYESMTFTVATGVTIAGVAYKAGNYIMVFLRDLGTAGKIGEYRRTNPLLVSVKRVGELRTAMANYDSAITRLKGLKISAGVASAGTFAALLTTVANQTTPNIPIVAGMAAGVATNEYYKGLADLTNSRAALTITCQAASTLLGLDDTLDCPA